LRTRAKGAQTHIGTKCYNLRYKCLSVSFMEKGMGWIVTYRFGIVPYTLLWVLSCCLSV
jgi:hypothetical protein